jgi:hypothetical protein
VKLEACAVGITAGSKSTGKKRPVTRDKHQQQQQQQHNNNNNNNNNYWFKRSTRKKRPVTDIHIV